MAGKEKVESMLSPYRVLDLTDEKGLFCGKLLGDLGADVIKVEKPGGDPARSIGPFYQDEEDPEKSLLWFAFNTSKRGITLDIEVPDGREAFKSLVKTADFIVESFPPGYMGKLGLGYEELEKINPGVIMISITPFGQTGPYKDYNAPDIVLWAMGGRMYSVGDADRPPLRISYHSQAYLQAGLDAAMVALLALYYRQLTGEGEFVDVSVQAAAAQPSDSSWDIQKRIRYRGGVLNPGLQIRRTWRCQDGLVTWIFMPGQMGGRRRNEAFINWMDSEGMADDFLKEFDWDNLDYAEVTQETIDRLEAPTVKFFMQHTKLELLEGAVKHRILFYPQFDTTDILESVQLSARGYWVELEHPELDATITYPGAFAKFSETPPQITRRAPLIGEHNQDIYKNELHMSDQEIKRLKQSKVI
jgi:crotonobetainyl-CoA:carnitine CoA-transferase CaiB-like acyl-CoA transferase